MGCKMKFSKNKTLKKIMGMDWAQRIKVAARKKKKENTQLDPSEIKENNDFLRFKKFDTLYIFILNI